MNFNPYPPCRYDPDHPEGEVLARFALLKCGDEDLNLYWCLAVETSQFIRSLEHKFSRHLAGRWFDEHSAYNALLVLEQLSEFERNSDLVARWKDWDHRFKKLHDQSPRYRLIDLIAWISETHCYLSWPHLWERQIYEWAMFSNDHDECPFNDHRRVLDAGYRLRLRDTIIEADGFLVLSDYTDDPVFVPTQKLEAVWKKQEREVRFRDPLDRGVCAMPRKDTDQQMFLETQNESARETLANNLFGALKKFGKFLRRET